MDRSRARHLPGRIAALPCALSAALAAGCLGHARPLALDDPGATPVASRVSVPLELREGHVEVVVQGEPQDAAATDALRAHVARTLQHHLGTPTQGAAAAHTRLTLGTPRPPFVVTGPYQRYSFALETELPGGRVVHTATRTVLADDDASFALEQWAGLTASAQGALALGLAGAAFVVADNDPNEAARWLAFSALPTASAAVVTAVLAGALGGHARAHASRRASDGLALVLAEHAVDLKDDLARHGELPAAAPVERAASAVSLVLHDETSCLSRVDLERDLEAMVPASSSARYTLEASVRPGVKDELAVHLVLTRAGATTALAERELSVARADCGTLARAVARIARMQIEASTSGGGGAP